MSVAVLEAGGNVVSMKRQDGSGISGDASDKDEYAAIMGVRAAGLTPHPEQPADNWQGAGL